MNLAFQPLDPDLNWELFDNDLPIPAADLVTINYLTIPSAMSLWSELFSSDPSRVVHVQLPKDHWARQFTDYGPAWDHYTNDLTLHDDVMPFLLTTLPWDVEQQVVLVHSSRYVLATKFDTFLKHWRAFISKNDDPVLLCLNRPEFILFGDTGMLAVGQRPLVVGEVGKHLPK